MKGARGEASAVLYTAATARVSAAGRYIKQAAACVCTSASILSQIFGRVRVRVLIWIGEITHVSAATVAVALLHWKSSRRRLLPVPGIRPADPGLYGNVGQIYHSGLTVQFSYLCAAGALSPFPVLVVRRSLTRLLPGKNGGARFAASIAGAPDLPPPCAVSSATVVAPGTRPNCKQNNSVTVVKPFHDRMGLMARHAAVAEPTSALRDILLLSQLTSLSLLVHIFICYGPRNSLISFLCVKYLVTYEQILSKIKSIFWSLLIRWWKALKCQSTVI